MQQQQQLFWLHHFQFAASGDPWVSQTKRTLGRKKKKVGFPFYVSNKTILLIVHHYLLKEFSEFCWKLLNKNPWRINLSGTAECEEKRSVPQWPGVVSRYHEWINDSSHYFWVTVVCRKTAEGEKPRCWRYVNKHPYHTARMFACVTTNWMFPASLVGEVWLQVLWIVNNINTLLMLWMSTSLSLSFLHGIS